MYNDNDIVIVIIKYLRGREHSLLTKVESSRATCGGLYKSAPLHSCTRIGESSLLATTNAEMRESAHRSSRVHGGSGGGSRRAAAGLLATYCSLFCCNLARARARPRRPPPPVTRRRRRCRHLPGCPGGYRVHQDNTDNPGIPPSETFRAKIVRFLLSGFRISSPGSKWFSERGNPGWESHAVAGGAACPPPDFNFDPMVLSRGRAQGGAPSRPLLASSVRCGPELLQVRCNLAQRHASRKTS